MIEYILGAVRTAGVKECVCVLGHGSREVKSLLKGVKTVKQARPLGSGDALASAGKAMKGFNGDILVLCGDSPLIRPETLRLLMNGHKKEKNSCTMLTTEMPDPTGYGRVVRNGAERIVKVVEENEASVFEKAIEEINVGTYCFRTSDIFPLLGTIKNDNKKKEYYLTDIIELMHKKGVKVGSVTTEDSDEALGVNSRSDLAEAGRVLRRRTAEALMSKGVTIVDPATTYINDGVKIESDTVIHPHTVIEKDVAIGAECSIGPFARIRAGCRLDDGVAVGNFVELVRARIGRNTKVKHHTYLGDTIVGRGVNIGAGTITANYDGKGKYVTRIDDGAFIGCGTVLVAPVSVGRNAVTGAGSVVTKNRNVPPNSVVAGVPARRLKKKRGAE
jgi:bifunctional UDP-N-acetylglucosamine pyrophosphorylase/glucosamine-1-phosphate N-acetyltransferase